jgi:hypothetical protein
MAGVVASRGFQSWTFLRADWCAARRRAQYAEWSRQLRVCGDLRYDRKSGRCAWHGRPIGPKADWGDGVQDGGVVMMHGGSVGVKGGSIARSKAVRGPRC